MVWGIINTVATRIPWSKLAQNAPLFVEIIGRAKDRLNAPAQKIHDDQLKLMQEENARLKKDLLAMSNQLQKLTSRVFTLKVITAVSLLIAASSLVIWAL